MQPLSLVVIAKDEQDRIARCLDSVPCAAERLVLDSGSSDATVQRAREAGARVLCTDWPGHVAQKNRAMQAAAHRWILSLDADEWLSAEAHAEIQRVLEDPRAAGYSLPRCNHWLGTPLRHGRWYPDRRVRLVRRDRARWVGDDPHDRLEVEGRVLRLRADIHHVPYRSLSDHLSTIDRYTQIQARAMHRRGLRARRRDVLARPPLHFVDSFLLRAGWRDGLPGYAVATLGSTHVLCKWLRLWQLGQGAAGEEA